MAAPVRLPPVIVPLAVISPANVPPVAWTVPVKVPLFAVKVPSHATLKFSETLNGVGLFASALISI
jgi:hypothetical protein